MNLVGNEQMVGRDAERPRHARAVLGDSAGFVARSHASVERSVDARGDAAASGEESMREPLRAQCLRLEKLGGLVHVGVPANPWKPGGAGNCRLATTIALNSAPISPGPLPTRRWRAASISAACAGAARLVRACAR
jgi:hypothetical protein